MSGFSDCRKSRSTASDVIEKITKKNKIKTNVQKKRKAFIEKALRLLAFFAVSQRRNIKIRVCQTRGNRFRPK